MPLGCEHSPSVSGGVTRRKSRQKLASRGWKRDRESLARVASVVPNASRKRESRNEVANASREMGSQMGVAKWGREWESRNGVAKNKKFGGAYVKEDPKGSNYLNKNSTKKYVV